MNNKRIADLLIDERVDLTKLTGRSAASIPGNLHPVWDGSTMASSFYAATGIHPLRGGLYDPTSMAAVCNGANKYYLVNSLLPTQPEFTSIIHDEGGIVAVYEDDLRMAWKEYKTRIEQECTARRKQQQLKASKAAFEKRIIDLGSD